MGLVLSMSEPLTEMNEMKSKGIQRRIVAGLLAVAGVFGMNLESQASTIVRFEMGLQTSELTHVDIQLFDDRPQTRDQFLQYVLGHDNGTPNPVDDIGPLYDGTFFHRLAFLQDGRPFVLQGGGFYPGDGFPPVDFDGNPNTPNPNIPNEADVDGDGTIDRSNIRGTIAMAKVGGDPDSATNQFFFNYIDNSTNLDSQNGGFTVFARVIGNGMELLDLYTGLEISNQGGGAFSTVPVLRLNGDDGIRGTEDDVLIPATIESATVLDVIAGDSNLDGIVNLEDLALLADNFGQSSAADWDDITWTEGDYNGDGTVNLADLALMATNFGQSTSLFNGGGSASSMTFEEALSTVSIPEPGSFGLLLLASVGGMLRRNRRMA